MMTPKIEALARRAVACKGWRWMPGMLHRNRTNGNGTRVTEENVNYCWSGWPDLSDPATKGCMLALAMDAWGKPGIHARRGGLGIWAVYADPWLKRRPFGRGDTEAEALVAALEAAHDPAP